MADKQKGKEGSAADGKKGVTGEPAPAAKPKKKAKEGGQVSAAKAPGSAAGKAVTAEPQAPAVRRISTKIPKLAKKNKSRLPRRQKKAAQKAQQAASRK
jgi:hypothetical protein